MSNKNEVFEYLIDQLRQQLPVVDVMGEIKRWSIDRSIAGRGNYTDEENAVIDAYICLEHNPYKQQCEDLAHEVQSLKNQLRDASARETELQKALNLLGRQVSVLANRFTHEPGQFGCRKENKQECHHNWRFVNGKAPAVCINCGVTKADECKHTHTAQLRKGFAPGFTKKCLDCGAKLK